MLTPAQQRTLAGINAGLTKMIRYDDESLVHETWIRQRYDCGCYPTYGPARKAAVRTAWHEAGHAVAALASGARFTSASIHHCRDSEGRVHRIRGGGDTAFVIDAAGQIAERLMTWTTMDDDELRRWLPAGGPTAGTPGGSAAASLPGSPTTNPAPGGTARPCWCRCAPRSGTWPGRCSCIRGTSRTRSSPP
jgi:hypothetical protein